MEALKIEPTVILFEMTDFHQPIVHQFLNRFCFAISDEF